MRWAQYLFICLVGALMALFVENRVSNKINDIYEKINYELVLFSSPVCQHCAYFENKVIPFYLSHDLAQQAPLQTVNMDEKGTGPYHLSSPINTLPTIIVMKNGRETGRINGMVDKIHLLAIVRDLTEQ